MTLCELREEYSIFGAGLGFLLLARACGATAENCRSAGGGIITPCAMRRAPSP